MVLGADESVEVQTKVQKDFSNVRKLFKRNVLMPPEVRCVGAEGAETTAELLPTEVAVKQEPSDERAVEVPIRRLVGKQSLTPALKREILVKEEPVAVKREFLDVPTPARFRSLDHETKAKQFYRFQSAFIGKVIPAPWHLCWGALGSGIIGVQHKAPAQSFPTSETGAGIVLPTVDAAVASSEQSRTSTALVEPAAVAVSSSQAGVPSGMVDHADQEAMGEEDSRSDLPASPDGAEEHDSKICKLPSDATIVLLQTLSLQGRNGKVLGGYSAPRQLNVEQKTLHWSTQRGDSDGKKMATIVQHQKAGGRVVVGVRSANSNMSKDFQLLGEVSHISRIEMGQFLIEEGDYVINERGTSVMHKALGPSCMTEELRRGVGLQVLRYPLPEKYGNVRFCKACCYKCPCLDLHFEEMNPSGITAFSLKRRHEEVAQDLPQEQHAKRMKAEPSDEADAVMGENVQGQAKSSDISIKREPLEAVHEVASPADSMDTQGHPQETFCVKKESLYEADDDVHLNEIRAVQLTAVDLPEVEAADEAANLNSLAPMPLDALIMADWEYAGLTDE